MKNNMVTKKKNIHLLAILCGVYGALSFGMLVYPLMWLTSYIGLANQYILWSVIIAILFGVFVNELYLNLAYTGGLMSQKADSIKNNIGEPAMKEIIIKDVQGLSENEIYNEIYTNNIEKLINNISETEEYKSIINKLDMAVNAKYPSDEVTVTLPDNPVDVLLALRCHGFYAEVIDNSLYVEIKH